MQRTKYRLQHVTWHRSSLKAMHLEHHYIYIYAEHRDGPEKEEQRLESHNLETTGDLEEPMNTIQQEEKADRRLHAAGQAEEVVRTPLQELLTRAELSQTGT